MKCTGDSAESVHRKVSKKVMTILQNLQFQTGTNHGVLLDHLHYPLRVNLAVREDKFLVMRVDAKCILFISILRCNIVYTMFEDLEGSCTTSICCVNAVTVFMARTDTSCCSSGSHCHDIYCYVFSLPQWGATMLASVKKFHLLPAVVCMLCEDIA